MKTPATEPRLRSQLLPKVSFRLSLAVTALAAIIAAVARSAGEGGALATAAVISLVFPVACFALMAVFFLISWCVSTLWYEYDDDALKGSPFADGQLPPQILPPRDQTS